MKRRIGLAVATVATAVATALVPTAADASVPARWAFLGSVHPSVASCQKAGAKWAQQHPPVYGIDCRSYDRNGDTWYELWALVP
ncbi:hypothetical protein [Streptomyces sp. WMMB303]|uniref:hypothetical protein n=1 Tax=Streptomyces sp. WMMB303 TaxID=3034154 RepID=UPI0023ECC3AF|nr:hypothetical protein [Streptomyces sp. WMMB303]MDF4248779.1 hypothetical protein [Streptomyces sp. WMMB303]